MGQNVSFENRDEAGERLAVRLRRLPWAQDPLVILGLTMNGVPVAAAVARALGRVLDISLVETLRTAQGLTVGAVSESALFMDARLIVSGELTRVQFDLLRARGLRTLKHRRNLFAPLRPEVELRGATVVLVDDVLRTGSTMRAAVEAARLQRPARVVVAAPVTSDVARHRLAPVVDSFITIASFAGSDPRPFYGELESTTDDDVARILADAASRHLTAA